MTAPLLQVSDLKKHYPITGGVFSRVVGQVQAVDGVSFEIMKGETLSLVGESGCGKSTVGKAILRLFDITSGQVVLDGQRIDDLSPAKLRPFRQRVQVVFQDPFSSLNPRMRVRDILAEPIQNFGLAKTDAELDERVGALMDKVGLPRDAVNRWPHEFSGGQRQRIAIARAILRDPAILILDEATSMVDAESEAEIAAAIREFVIGRTCLIVAHRLSTVMNADEIVVLDAGRVIDRGTHADLMARCDLYQALAKTQFFGEA